MEYFLLVVDGYRLMAKVLARTGRTCPLIGDCRPRKFTLCEVDSEMKKSSDDVQVRPPDIAMDHYIV